MRILASTLLCVSLAACSHDRPAESAYDTTVPSADMRSGAQEPAMTPASAEGSAARRSATDDANRREARALSPQTGTQTAAQPSMDRSSSSADTSASNGDRRDASAAPSTIGDERDSSSAKSGNVQADNTKVNQRDRNGQNPTPTTQSNSESDLRITQQIRKAVMGDKSLSFMAKNVKIITSGGHVVLRGTVKTDAERASIDKAARDVAGADQVENQIDVKQ